MASSQGREGGESLVKKIAGFSETARHYARRHLLYRLGAEGIRLAPLGLLLGTAIQFLAVSQDLFPLWLAFPVAVLPSIGGIAAVFLKSRTVSSALSWLDAELDGKQELQAAWDFRNEDSVLCGLVRASGEAILKEHGTRSPGPKPGTAAVLLTLATGAVFLLMLLTGRALFSPAGPELRARGAELESWAESWAEGVDGTGRPESRELARRMGELGRRMADGAMSETQSQRALRELEEEIEERRDDLVRDKLAESLVEDLGIDREAAEMFRVQRRRLPSDLLAELGTASEGNSTFSQMSKDAIDKLLSDPDFRDRLGNGTPELTEELTEALKDALDPQDPMIDEFDNAAAESRKAGAGEEEEFGGNGRNGENEGNEGNEGDGQAKAGGPEDLDQTGGQSGGSGRGSTPAEDQQVDSSNLNPSTAEEPLHLPTETDRTGSWRTVIRAYTEDGEAPLTPGGGTAGEWRQEVESVIRREDIPSRTRDYVRDYFLALEEGPSEYNDEE
jgi:hypothetical protein